MYDILIKNGTVVTHEASFDWDVAIRDGKTAAVGVRGSLEGGSGGSCGGAAKEVVDASGKLVMPGLIDPHVHIHHPFKDGFSADDFYSATVAAACGGDTTVLDFAIQWDQSFDLSATAQNRNSQFEGDAVIDYSFHACPTVSSMETVEQVPRLIEAGIPSFKLYMTYSRQGRMCDDGVLYEVLKQTAQRGAVVGVHAENDAMCMFNSDQFVKKGWDVPRYFPLCKGNLVEAEAVNRVIYMNREAGGSLYLFHLTARQSLALVKEAKGRGENVTAETCTHYLLLNSDRYDREDGVNFICSPPLRSEEDREALWKGIREGFISVVSSDHCGFTAEMKRRGGGRFPATPNGLPGVELRLPAVYTEGVKKGRISINKLVEILSVNPAKVFGMYPQKGAIACGSDADITIVDPAKKKVVSAAGLHSPADWSPYDGMELCGFADTVISKGKFVVREGSFCGCRGAGRFVKRMCSER
ncbi:dihydropyrimidinase [Bacilliculturomica massiliensis]|uniref:dihydropyrimidinase n=1 Tax=Bacilliculturomica massiliensis TaxID=1917867 RepID=UPI001030AF24|nr:dihydropyrimidinase [Bacilliculturomica massiliensis]